MKKSAAIMMFAVALVATLAFLRREAGGFNNDEHGRFQTALWQIKHLDTSFNEAVLKSRFALVDNYDDFQMHAADLELSLEKLRHPPGFVTPAGLIAITNAHQQYLAILDQREKLFEPFKTQNARVGNSRHYLPGALEELATRLAVGAITNQDDLALQAITADIARLLLKRLATPEESPENAQTRVQQLKDWCARHPQHPEARFAESLARHAANIVKGNGAVDEMTRGLLALPTSDAIQKLFQAYETEVTGALGRTQQFRLMLYALGFVTTLGLGYTFWALRAANRNLDHRVRERTSELEGEVAERKQAEEKLRESQSFLQSTLDALSAHIAILDEAGHIIAVNGVWKNFAATNDFVGNLFGVGMNYLQVCEAATGECATEAFAVAKGIRAVMADHQREFHLEYPCHSPSEARWFEVRVTRFGHEGPVRTVVAHENITQRKQAEEKLREAHQQLLDVSRQAGMAEVATNVLHNVGNVLNSVNVSATLVADAARKSRAASLQKVVSLLDAHATDLGNFFATDPKGVQLPGYLRQLSEHLSREQQNTITELDLLCKNIEHIKGIVTMQQGFAKVSGVTETVHVPELLEDALRMNAASLQRHHIQVQREFAPLPPIPLDKSKTLQILVNLIRNAKHACADSGRDEKLLTVRAANSGTTIKISVRDNGVGIPPENLDRIFNHGFTTKKNGHGFGLHSGANAAKEMGGTLRVHSDGPGTGATFTLELPAPPKATTHV